MEEKNKNILLVLALILLVFFAWTHHSQIYSIVIAYGSEEFPPEQMNSTWQGNPIGILAPSFEQLSCSNQKQFCGCSDGEVVISNSFTSGGTLTLISAMGAQYRSCGGNYITTNLTLPKGVLHGKCTIYGSAPIQVSNGPSGGLCEIKGLYSFSKIANEFGWDRLGISQVSDTFSLTLNKTTEIQIYLESATASSGSGNAKLELTFDENLCQENWTCGDWSNCSSGTQTRTCTDSNACGTMSNKPSTSQSCTVECSPVWACTAWSNATGSCGTRNCTDSHNCGVIANKPLESKTCSYSCQPNWQTGSWSTCTNGVQTRTVTDLNSCGDDSNKPSASQSCCSIFWCKPVFHVGDFEFTGTYLVIALSLFALLILTKKRR